MVWRSSAGGMLKERLDLQNYKTIKQARLVALLEDVQKYV